MAMAMSIYRTLCVLVFLAASLRPAPVMLLPTTFFYKSSVHNTLLFLDLNPIVMSSYQIVYLKYQLGVVNSLIQVIKSYFL